MVDLTKLREDVALANRIVHRFGLVTALGHVSARVPETETFLIPTRASPAFADADHLLLLNFDGELLTGAGTPNTEFWIHARIYAHRPDVGAVAHVHPLSCIALSQIGQTVQVLHNSGAMFSSRVPVFERPGLIRSRELGDEVAMTLSDSNAMLLRGHGANLAASDVRRATVLACFLEEAADIQLRALAAVSGDATTLYYYTSEEIARVREQIDDSGPMDRAWEYYSRMTAHSQPLG